MKFVTKKVKDIVRGRDFFARFGGEEFALLLPQTSLSGAKSTAENIRDFFVCEEDGKIVGCCAIRVMWEDLAEIKSLAVSETNQSQGIGTALLKVCLDEARILGITTIFALTTEPDFFIKKGFMKVDKNKLPHKIWSECIRCVKFPDCDEEAVVIKL